MVELSAYRAAVTIGGYGRYRICLNRIVRFIRIGCSLHLTALAGVGCFWQSLSLLSATHSGGKSPLILALYTFMAVYGALLPIFAELDALSRYQNYKKAKDLFHENGFDPRIVRLFIHSRCQRDAVRVAARDLGMEDELDRYYQGLGYRWFHVLPDFVFKRPMIFFSFRYWQKTLFESRYALKHFWW
jgi:hypothetical protein